MQMDRFTPLILLFEAYIFYVGSLIFRDRRAFNLNKTAIVITW